MAVAFFLAPERPAIDLASVARSPRNIAAAPARVVVLPALVPAAKHRIVFPVLPTEPSLKLDPLPRKAEKAADAFERVASGIIRGLLPV